MRSGMSEVSTRDRVCQHEQWEVPTGGRPAGEMPGEKSNIRRELSINPGLPIDKRTGPFIATQGGSEPGVASLNGLLERNDGKRFVFSITLNETNMALDESKAIVQRAIEFVGKGTTPADGVPRK